MGSGRDVVSSVAAWLDAALVGERQALTDFLDRRHSSLAAGLEQRLRDALGPALGKSELELEVSGHVVGAQVMKQAEATASMAPPDPPEVQDSHDQARQLETEKQKEEDGAQSGPYRFKVLNHIDEFHFAWPHTLLELVRHPGFEFFFSALIICNSVCTAAELQFDGIVHGNQMGWLNGWTLDIYAPVNADDAIPIEDIVIDTDTFDQMFMVLGWLFGVLFTIELLLKLGAQGLSFVRSPWNCFDAALIFVWLMNKVVTDNLPVNPMVLRLLRMARVMRMLCLMRLFSTSDSLQPLKLLLHSIAGSASILFWTIVMLTLLMSLMSFFMMSILDGYLTDDLVPPERRERVFLYFGTFSRSMLSMFEVTLGNWIPITRLLSENVNESYTLMFIAYKAIIGFGVVKVVSGVFMHETFRAASSDDELMVMQNEAQQRNHKKKMAKLFLEVDTSGDGRVSWQEFQVIASDPRMKTWLAAMELQVSDSEVLWTLLDDGGDGSISADELVSGVKKLKGTARSMDMMTVMRELDEIRKVIREEVGALQRIEGEEQRIEGAVEGKGEARGNAGLQLNEDSLRLTLQATVGGALAGIAQQLTDLRAGIDGTDPCLGVLPRETLRKRQLDGVLQTPLSSPLSTHRLVTERVMSREYKGSSESTQRDTSDYHALEFPGHWQTPATCAIPQSHAQAPMQYPAQGPVQCAAQGAAGFGKRRTHTGPAILLP